MRKRLLVGMFTLISTTAYTTDKSQMCSSRSSSFVQSSEQQLPVVENWKISAEKSGSQVSCRASRTFSDGGNGTVLYLPKGDYRGGQWFLGILSPQRKLPRDHQGPAHLLIDGKDLLIGEIFDTGSSTGGKRTSTFVRADFPKLDSVVTQLKNAARIEIRAEVEKWNDLEVPTLKTVIKALEDCAAKATGTNNDKFWKNATNGCG